MFVILKIQLKCKFQTIPGTWRGIYHISMSYFLLAFSDADLFAIILDMWKVTC